jgi:hypothetical protein
VAPEPVDWVRLDSVALESVALELPEPVPVDWVRLGGCGRVERWWIR